MPLANRSEPTRDFIFVSYSHRDRDWLEHLQIFLKPYTRQNLKVWADPYIEVGGQWRRDIAAALLRSCVGVLLVSPHFLASDFIESEELPLLLEGAEAGSIILVVVPVSASNYEATPLTKYQFAHPPERPLDSMRKAQRNAALVEITKKIVAAAHKAPVVDAAPPPAARTLELAPVAATEAIGALHGVPAQRPNYLRRQEFLDQLKQAVLGEAEQAVGITGATPQGARVGLHGMGGIGKTTLAIDLVNDEKVRHAFPDGIFWLTLGQSVEPLQLQSELSGYLTGEAKAYANLKEGQNQLRGLLQDKSCLLVLDDLWHQEDTQPFDVLGSRSRLLVTTRDADLLAALGARELALDVLSETLALELLAAWSRQAQDALPPVASKVAENCGYLPLALELAGAHVASGKSWERVQSALEQGQLEFLDHPYGSVFKSLRLGTDALPEFDRDRYFELAVFPEDAQIPVEAISTLWHHTGNMQPEASPKLLLRLHRRALLIRSDDRKRISFHDLQHDFLRLNIPSLVKGHEALVDAYRAVAPSGWASGPDDGYFFQHLPQHLVAADRIDQLKALLCDYEWLAAKLRATNITALLGDYDLVGQDPDLALIQQALRLSIPAISRNNSHLPGQLLGRLKGLSGPAIEALLEGADKGHSQIWLCPRFTSLTPPGGALVQFLTGHASMVSAVAVLADGSRSLSGSYDWTLRLWDLTTGETLRTLVGHTAPVQAVAMLADDSRALSGSDDNTLRLWDLATGETLRTLEGHTSGVHAVVMLANDSRALSGSDDKTLRLWDLATGETLRTLEGHTSGVSAVAVLADGSRALSGSSDNTLRLWDLATGETLCTLAGHTHWVTAIAVLADGSRALSGSWDNTLRLWDLATAGTLRVFRGHTRPVTAVAVLADGNHALSGSQDKTLRLWDLATGETLRTFEEQAGWVSALGILTDGSRALSGSSDKRLRLWDLASGDTLRTLGGHTSGVSAVAVLADGSGALSGSFDNTLRLWDLATGATLRILQGHAGWVRAVAMLADGSRALSGSDDGTLRLWDLATGRTLRTLVGHGGPVTAVVVLTDGSRALSGSLDGTLRLWDLATGTTLRSLEGHSNVVNALAVLADGTRALSGSGDNTLWLWDLATGAPLRALVGHTSGVNAAAVLANGCRALSGSWDNTLRLWDLATGETLRTLEGHTGWVGAVAVLGDGSRALSGSDDNTLRLWDLATGECLADFVADAAIGCVAFARDDLIVAGSGDGKLHILEIREP
jgi:WD40 repeat protein